MRTCCVAQGTPLYCTVETNTTLQNNYTPIKKKKKDMMRTFKMVEE